MKKYEDLCITCNDEPVWTPDGDTLLSQKFAYGTYRVAGSGKNWELQLIYPDGSWTELGAWETADDAREEMTFYHSVLGEVFNSGIKYAGENGGEE